MNDTMDFSTMAIRSLVLVVVLGVFYFILKGEKKK